MFINPDLSPVVATLAYEQRQLRRQRGTVRQVRAPSVSADMPRSSSREQVQDQNTDQDHLTSPQVVLEEEVISRQHSTHWAMTAVLSLCHPSRCPFRTDSAVSMNYVIVLMDNFSRLVHVLDDCDEDRHSPWMYVALRRYHFRRRIQSLSRVLEPVLSTEHRLAIMLRNAKMTDSDTVW